ncbi:MAG: ABC transporter substrate-binding protein [Alphaproteobacteria bacterium]|nr:ABC transporter substrate-binding protein [Alphaproteobacteria bacterium]
MKLKKLILAAVGMAVGITGLTVAEPVQADEQYMPLLVYRSGPYAPGGIPYANGLVDYYKHVNAQGGVNGVKLTWEECDTGYNTARGVECYERIKMKDGKKGAVVTPLSTGITYALIERAAKDGIVIHSMGYGRTAASDGTVFPLVFTAPATYWSQATAITKYIGSEVGGMDKLKGKKISLVYHDSAYGKEPIATFEALSKKYGFKFTKHPVAHPGLEQKATWLTIGRKIRPDYVVMWGWGVMNSTAIKEAAAVKFPMDKFIGNWWSSNENDTRPPGAASKGYKGASFNVPGSFTKLHADILKGIYGGDKAAAMKANWGEVLYNRGIINGAIIVEAMRVAQKKYGNRSVNGPELAYGFENMDMTEARFAELGMKDFMKAIKLSCADHEGTSPLIMTQWDGNTWKPVSDWIMPDHAMVRPMYKEAAMKYAKEKGITPRKCM